MEETEINNNIDINDINMKLERLSKRCEVLETQNNEYEKRMKKNEDIISNLNKQISFIRQEYNKKINELKLKNNNEKNEININKEEKHFDIKSLYEEIEKYLKIKLNELLYNIYEYLGKTQNKGNDEKIIKFEGGTLFEKFENQLFYIFFDKNKDISLENISKLRKLTAALLITYNKNKEYPLESVKLFLEKNINKNVDEITKMNIDFKRSDVLVTITDVALRKIDKENKDEFMKQFKEKYGILNDDISEKELKYLIEYKDYNENQIIKIILERLGYLTFDKKN